MNIRTPPIERFLKKVVVQDDGCHRWEGAWDHGQGYGNFRWGADNRVGPVHRYAYEQFVGPIPAGLTVDHLCRNPRCVNPFHLEAVTMKENILRSDAPSAHNAKKINCKRGHPLSGDNLYVSTDGRRTCRTCLAAAQKRWQQDNRDKTNAASKRWYAKNQERARAYGREYQRRKRAAAKQQETEPSP